MTAQGSEAWWQTLLKAAIEIWTTRVTLNALDRSAAGGMAWWDMLRRWAAAVAYRFGRLAIYAEHRYNLAKV